MTNSFTKGIKFPPITFFIAVILGFAAMQGYIQYTEAGETPEIMHVEPTLSTDSDTYQAGSWVEIMVMVGEHHGHGGEEMEDEHEEEMGEMEHEHEEEMVGMEEEHEHDAGEEAGHEHDEEMGEMGRFDVRVTIYDPDGNIVATEKGRTDTDGMAMFRIFIETESPPGTYTIVSEANEEGRPVVIGESLTIRVIS